MQTLKVTHAINGDAYDIIPSKVFAIGYMTSSKSTVIVSDMGGVLPVKESKEVLLEQLKETKTDGKQ